MVDPAGKPFEVAVMSSAGSKIFERFAVQAIEHSTFEPGTLDGKPIESVFEMKYTFAVPDLPPGARQDFVTAYKALVNAVDGGDRAAADAAMAELKITNLYEDAFHGLADYRYASRWGDESAQLAGLRRAIAAEVRAHYLPSGEWRSALTMSLRLEVKLQDYAGALRTWQLLQKAGIDEQTVAKIKPMIEQLETLRSDDRIYKVPGQITDDAWSYHLFKQHFRIEVPDGSLALVKLKCRGQFVYFNFDPQVQYDVQGKYGTCTLRLEGAPGTRFQLVQF
jgi:hypothetical protein